MSTLLVSPAKIAVLYGVPLAIADISGTVDGTSHMTLTPGDMLVANDVPYGETVNGVVGNFVSCIGDRMIDKRNVVGIQTIGWMFPSGRMLSLGSLYKKNSLKATNPNNKNVPVAQSKLDAVNALIGHRITVGPVTDIMVSTFRPAEGEPKEVAGTWAQFTVSKNKISATAQAAVVTTPTTEDEE